MLNWFKRKRNNKTEPEAAEAERPSAAEVPTGEAEDHEDFSRSPAAETAAGPAAPTAADKEDQSATANDSDSSPAGLFKRLRSRLTKTRDTLVSRVDSLFLGKKVIDAELFDELEEILITADIGMSTTSDLIESARAQVKRKELHDPQALKSILKTRILDYLLSSEKPAELVMPASGPFVIMVVGVNGVGKTTTIGKLAHKFQQSGQKVLLVAADTFRAAASEQLKIWGDRIGVDVVAQKTGADPSSVVFDGLEYARAKDFDVILVDTAGRLHTKANLMEELKKIKRVMHKKLAGAPHEVLLVIDATTGQNGISQARLFNEAVEVTGLALTKLDGTAKGGIIINICHEFDIPIRFIGIGEQMQDLRDFDPKEFVEALFGNTAAHT